MNRDINAAFNIADVYYHSLFPNHTISDAFKLNLKRPKTESDWKTKIKDVYKPQTLKSDDELQYLDFSKATPDNVDAYIGEIALRRREKLQIRLKARRDKKNSTRQTNSSRVEKNPASLRL